MQRYANRPVLAAHDDDILQMLQRWAREQLPEYMVPSAMVVMDALPMTRNGKVDRQALPPPNDERAVSLGYVAARDVVELELVRIWERLLGVQPIGVRDNFFNLGGHSLLAVRLMAEIEKQFHTKLRLAELVQSPNIEEIAALLRDGDTARELNGSPLVAITRGGARAPLFFVHPAGGIVLCYQELARCLGSTQPFYGLQHPSVFGRQEDMSLSVQELARIYTAAIRSVQPHGPYHLGGWSFGGLIAFEVASVLERDEEEIATLAVLDAVTPKEGKKRTDSHELFKLLAGFSLAWGFRVSEDELRALGPERAMEYVAELAAKAKLVPSDLGTEHVNRLYALGRATIDVCMSYEPGMYEGELTLIRVHDPVDRPQIIERDYGWGLHCRKRVAIQYVAGDHETMVQHPHVEGLAGVLRKMLG